MPEGFGLGDAGARLARHGPRAGGCGWRGPFGSLWEDLALDAGSRVDSCPPGRRSRRLLQAASTALTKGLGARYASGFRELALLHAATAALEASAVAWGQFGAVMGDQRVRLLRRLERGLDGFEVDVNCAERVIDIDARLAEIALSSAFDALERVVAGRGDRGAALARLEHAALEVAVLAVRGVINTERFGTPRPATVVTDAHLCALARTASQIAADAQARRLRAETSHAGQWLQDAILAGERVVRRAAIRAAARDPVLRADADAALRASWVALASAQLLVLAEIEALTSTRTYADWPELCAKLARVGCQALCGAALVQRPNDFDHDGAARHQRAAVVHSVGPLGIALQTGQRAHIEPVQRQMVERVGRVVAAVWSLEP
jgi:hypothetical protein